MYFLIISSLKHLNYYEILLEHENYILFVENKIKFYLLIHTFQL